jgi:RNA polymerase sigma factor (sigma-70 family)
MPAENARDRSGRAAVFARERAHLRSVAFRILASEADADDVVQEAWIRYDRANTRDVRNLPAWLTTVVTRLCVDLLRRRREVPQDPDDHVDRPAPRDEEPEEVALLAGELTAAFTLVLEELTPPQRVALTLHDVFGAPFEEVAQVLETSVDSAKKLASRARYRVRQRIDNAPHGSLAGESVQARRVVDAFLVAARRGDTDTLLQLLAPDVVRTADPQALPAGAAQRLQGAAAVVAETRALQANARRARVAVIDGQPGIVINAGRQVQMALVFHLSGAQITAYDVIAHPQRLARLQIT